MIKKNCDVSQQTTAKTTVTSWERVQMTGYLLTTFFVISPWTKAGSIIFSLKTTHTKCNTITNILQHQRS
jgi:hypothetical protein